MAEKIVIISTCASEIEAEKLARMLVDERLAACVSVIPQVRSYYRWEGTIESANECLLLIKSSRELFDALKARVEAAHSYEIPELLALPVIEGSEKYMSWLEMNLRPGTSKGSDC